MNHQRIEKYSRLNQQFVQLNANVEELAEQVVYFAEQEEKSHNLVELYVKM